MHIEALGNRDASVRQSLLSGGYAFGDALYYIVQIDRMRVRRSHENTEWTRTRIQCTLFKLLQL